MSHPPVGYLPVAVTADSRLRIELEHCARAAGTMFEFETSVPAARQIASQRPIVVVGLDLLRRVRRPLAASHRLVVIASLDADPQPVFAASGRVGALYVVLLPTGRDWLITTIRTVMS